LAVLAQGLKIGWTAFFTAAALVTSATVFMQVDVLLTASGSTDGLVFIFLPILLSVAVGLLSASELVIRTGLNKLRGD
jgi:hypothetical protein